MDASESEVHSLSQPESKFHKPTNLHMEFGFHESDTQVFLPIRLMKIKKI